MSTQTHSPGYVITAKRPARSSGYEVGLMLTSASTLTVTETSHSHYGLTNVQLPPRNFYEL